MRKILVILIFNLVFSSMVALSGCKATSPGNGGAIEDRPSLNLEMVRVLTGPGSGSVQNIAVDGEGNIYVAGRFTGVIDMDPGPGVINEQAAGNSESDIFLARYDPEGNYIWSMSWGSGGQETVDNLEIDSNGNIYVLGSYSGAVDFDPGPGTVIVSSTGNSGNFISRFNPLGGFVWVKTWEMGALALQLNGFCIDRNDRLIFTGRFIRKVDFDPGPGVYELDPNDGGTAFLLALTGDGDFEWVVRWGEAHEIDAKSVTTDPAGNIYVTGYFRLDAQEGLSDIQAHFNETTWAYISKFSGTGESEWWRCWGGLTPGCRPNFVGAASDDRIYVSGWYDGNIDLDPGPGTYIPVEYANVNAVMSGFNSGGDFTGALVFSNRGLMTSGILPYSDGSAYWFGHISGIIDIDPGPGEMIVGPPEDDDEGNRRTTYILCRYGPDGRLMMANYVANVAGLDPSCFTVDGNGNIFMAGQFGGSVDFDPGSGRLIMESAGETNNGYFAKFTPVE